MAEPTQPYRRLAGSLTVSGFCQLYLAADHLLQAASTGYSERYKRFYLRDIQAIIVQETEAWKIWGVVAAVPGAIALLIGLLVGDVGGWILDALGAALLGAGLASYAGGPSCRCVLRTAVQTEPLPALKRIRRARQVLACLQPLIEAAQGPLPMGAVGRRGLRSRHDPRHAHPCE